ncbi:MAG: TetR/AcrR family transcriptional regulator [Streptomycetaceae bacterium]|nr:TetR/AcrR family transcriptional regulator [Streptomycetaceae bacterium]
MRRPQPPRRADARRNYELLLTAAKQVFGEYGAGAPLDEVARRAGVGNATMYRHFPTRRDLLVAVYSDEVGELGARATALAEELPPGDALFAWLGEFAAHVADKRDLALAVPEGDDREGLFAQWHAVMRETAATLLDAARGAGAVRPDLAAPDLLALANGVAVTGADAAGRARLLGIVRHGCAPG